MVTGWQQLLHAVMADCPIRAAGMHVGACDKGQTSEGWGCRGGQLRGTGKARSHGDSLGGHTRVSGHTTHNLRCVLSTFVYMCVCGEHLCACSAPVCVGVCFEHLCVLQMNILVDTGSSNFAVAAAPHPFITHFFNTAL